MAVKGRVVSLIVIVTGAVCLAIGLVIGFLARQNGDQVSQVARQLVAEADPSISGKLINEIDANNIRDNLRYLTTKPHVAGTAADWEQAEYIRKLWIEQGLEAEIVGYDVLLSYPNISKPNMVSVVNSSSGKVEFASAVTEKILNPDQNQTGVLPPFNAFAPAGTVEGDLVYVNYGREQDFEQLTRDLGINVTDKIAIARYGKIFRGDKLKAAHKFGAKGLILYSDPADYAISGVDKVYPDSWWLPGTGAQRGNVVMTKGDQLTQGYPATEWAYRSQDKVLKAQLPQIPCQPIGYDDAKVLLRELGGSDSPEDWKGTLHNVAYSLGPGFKSGSKFQNLNVKLEVHNYNVRRMTYNVIGTIKGKVEPDRHVLVGNHRDAWVFGALDPSSGTATMLEVTRAFGKLKKAGWSPRRTLKFCSWGAEEYGYPGSTEWVEENMKSLLTQAVAYLNCDTAVRGNYSFRGRASPLLKAAMLSATRKVKDPHNADITVHDTWAKYDPAGGTLNEPRVNVLGAGSDFTPFIQHVGIPVTDQTYTYTSAWKISSYPVYHSVYETFEIMEKFIDPDFTCHKAVAQVLAELARNLADSLLLPMNPADYASAIETFANASFSSFGGIFAKKDGISFDGLYSAVKNFSSAANEFSKKIENVDKNNPLAIREINDQMLMLERAFIDPQGLPGRPLFRHIIFAPSSKNIYAASSFPGLSDLMYGLDENGPEEQWEEVKKHLAVIVYTIQAAAKTLS
ncbi:N-acetylated-alpha-linked acidic dipeptidase 2-like [Lingula anatina]|uniref:Glutamate carboxypeptidase 2 n=1 Tax=Lingula anatina TaxID=7574 RepID=A0A1S3J9X1_LINAN|nr:N-acetylated-alpha-linked acidic dipeptidase 2-like [Lingula anatina]|eukprot:XP_013407202.1 N-acetylated-alpha-linked acidic dipeptidase 2-like [Lingula anatina]